jgi:hypothetical protein
MRSVKRGLIITAVLLSPVAFVSGCWAVQTAQVNAFYQSHELLNAMHAASRDGYPKDPAALRQKAFHERIPLGALQAEVVETLKAEGFACQQWKKTLGFRAEFDCFLTGDGADKAGRWLVHAEFDGQSKLVYANIVILK